jgi:hypothetical protein
VDNETDLALMRRRTRATRLIPAIWLALALWSDQAAAGNAGPIIGQWCGVEDYVIAVAPGQIAFRARRGFYSPPAFDVKVAYDHADYRQRYDAMEVTVSCRLSLKGPQLAIESCDNPADSFYPKAGETAELHRCVPKPEPSV